VASFRKSEKMRKMNGREAPTAKKEVMDSSWTELKIFTK
jgi:hypothetical protein